MCNIDLADDYQTGSHLGRHPCQVSNTTLNLQCSSKQSPARRTRHSHPWPSFNKSIDESSSLKTIDLKVIVIPHRVGLELHEYDHSFPATPVGRRGKEHVCKGVSESAGLSLECFIDHRCKWRKLLLQG